MHFLTPSIVSKRLYVTRFRIFQICMHSVATQRKDEVQQLAVKSFKELIQTVVFLPSKITHFHFVGYIHHDCVVISKIKLLMLGNR